MIALTPRQRLQSRPQRTASAQPLPSPVGGWNVRDAVTAMPPEDALEIINWFPRQTDVVARNGYTLLSDLGVTDPVETLHAYHHGATKKLLACAGSRIFEAIGNTTLATGLGSAAWHSTRMGDRLIMCNGVDTPKVYDGSTLSNHGFTDPSSTLDFTKLNFAFTFKSRVYFIEKDTQKFWYGGVQAVSGPLAAFNLALTGQFAGSLKILAAITNDGGDGKDDLFVAIFSEGDVAVYQGSDPGGSDWSHVGTYKIGEPLSRFAHAANGADLTIATTRGYEQLARSTRQGEGVRLRDLVSDKIQKEVVQRIQRVGARDDWHLILYNRGQMLIVQVPINNDAARHHVRNINTGAWTRFDLPDARSWVVLDKRAYMGSRDGKVYLFDEGETDNGGHIVLSATMAWTALGARTAQKILNMLKFNFSGTYFPTITVSVATDFGKHVRETQLGVGSQQLPAYWNTAEWNEAYWSSGITTREYWHKHGAFGTFFSVKLQCQGHQGQFSWNATTYIANMGGII